MQVSAIRKEAHDLMHEGTLALSKVTSNGIHIDVPYLKRTRKQVRKQIEVESEAIAEYPEIRWWQRKYGESFNLNSNQQLGDVLFNHLGYEPPNKRTKAGNIKLDAEILEEIAENTGNEMLGKLVHIWKLEKAQGTYLKGILAETNDDGFLRPNFSLCLARSYRSSSSNPNFQNQPNRDKEIKRYIRTAFIPRPGRQILEADFSGSEVKCACYYHKDPNMYAYLTDPTKDMHRDMAQQLYKLANDEWNKPIRQAAKNKFVFPEFYGSYYKNVGPDLWKYAGINKLRIGKQADGILLHEHLARKGMANVDVFTEYVRQVEDHFWGERFPVYTQWKDDWWDEYNAKGYFDSLSGFRYKGLMRRNEVINYPVQGSSFHMLLWVLIQLQQWLERRGMRTLIIGQIHDSLVIDLEPSEKEAVLRKIYNLVTFRLREHWSWIYFPMVIEAELAPIDAPWTEKAEIPLDEYK